ncbi:MAG: hypothetical protein VX600_01010 [Candidatus Neomarinimicrobiota bacterium]|nr:hypothetical protein [Candidatus Neomarinimicrobiota bacterium]
MKLVLSLPIMKYEKNKVIQNIVEKNKPDLLIQILWNNFHVKNVFSMVIKDNYYIISQTQCHRIVPLELGAH